MNGAGQDCWYWESDMGDPYPDRIFSCQPGASGGDYVVEYTTGPAQSSLSLDATILIPSQYANIAVDLLEGSCYLGPSVYCGEANPGEVNGLNTFSTSVPVSPSTTYYLWTGNGWTGGAGLSPRLELCIY